jgi:hypothetical protein
MSDMQRGPLPRGITDFGTGIDEKASAGMDIVDRQSVGVMHGGEMDWFSPLPSVFRLVCARFTAIPCLSSVDVVVKTPRVIVCTEFGTITRF